MKNKFADLAESLALIKLVMVTIYAVTSAILDCRNWFPMIFGELEYVTDACIASMSTILLRTWLLIGFAWGSYFAVKMFNRKILKVDTAKEDS